MSKLKLIDIYNLSSNEDFEEAIILVSKTIETLEDLESYYFKLCFYEEQEEMKKTRQWWEKKLFDIKLNDIDFRRNNEGDKND